MTDQYGLIKTDHGNVEVVTVRRWQFPDNNCPQIPPLDLTEEQFASFQKSPEEFAARLFNVSVAEYRDWRESQGFVQCAAKALSGRRCENSISGSQLMPAQWLAALGQYCSIHGGPTSLECRAK
jgi:hypothetical protein